ncbi:helicase [Fusarium albosuccineum]|uniref:DNA 3'-5' helicase n=1 Tax=Fusarium albosuccineum TaxID=1237068 RepID=A0A8H4P521_9HYPO|nr:helicase [Fusarium albosuccineum]
MSFSAIKPLAIIPNYPLVSCTTCGYCVVLNHIPAHLNKHHGILSAARREEIMESLQVLQRKHGLISDQDGLSDIELPKTPIPEFTELAPAVPFGLRCHHCPFVCTNSKSKEDIMVKHQRRSHTADELGGAMDDRKAILHHHTTYDVWTQRFFNNNLLSQYFEVTPTPGTEVQAVAEDGTPFGPSSHAEGLVMQMVTRATEAQSNAIKAMTTLSLDRHISADEVGIQSGNGWLYHVQWPHYYRGIVARDVLRLKAEPTADEPLLALAVEILADSVRWMFAKAGEAAKMEHNASAGVNRRAGSDKPRRWTTPSGSTDTIHRYGQFIGRVFIHYHRTETPPLVKDTTWEPTSSQAEAYRDLWEAIRRAQVESTAGAGRRAVVHAEDSATTLACLRFVLSLFDHDWKRGQSGCILYGTLATFCLQADGSWLQVQYTTKVIAGLLSTARAAIFSQSLLSHRQSGHPISQGVDDMVSRFMVPTGPSAYHSTPGMWLARTLAYGRRLCKDIASPHSISWSDDKNELDISGVTLRMDKLGSFAHHLTESLEKQLASLVLVDDSPIDSVEEQLDALPTIPWGQIHDDPNNNQPFWSFLQSPVMDLRKSTSESSGTWIWRRLLRSPALVHAWLRGSGKSDCTPSLRQTEVDRYLGKVRAFLDTLALSFYFLSGQPSRAPELVSFRWCNGREGALRNIFIDDGQVYTLSLYHKCFRQNGAPSPVYRFLPHRVGRCLIWYLWLVIPFLGTIGDDGAFSHVSNPYLFTGDVHIAVDSRGRPATHHPQETELAGPTEAEGDDGRDSDDEDMLWETGEEFPGAAPEPETHASPPGAASQGFVDVFRSRHWYPGRFCSLVLNECAGHMAPHLGVSRWRHAASAIGRQYCGGFEVFDQETSAEPVNPFLDRQQNHTSTTAENYGRPANHNPQSGSHQSRAKFRVVSLNWHHFLGLQSSSRSGAALPAAHSEPSSSSSPWIADASTSLQRASADRRAMRLRRLADIDWLGRLRAYRSGFARDTTKDTFKPTQRETISAVAHGLPFIIQIGGTGIGKSMTFELVAHASPVGVTIVVAPFSLLREAHHRRCQERGVHSHSFDPRVYTPTCQIIVVTPEHFLTQKFASVLARLRNDHLLDRIVIDEAHVVLDAHLGFRSTVLELCSLLGNFGVQLVFLSASLPPREMPTFMSRLHLPEHGTKVIRARTRQTKIRYKVKLIPHAAVKEQAARAASVAQDYLRLFQPHGGKVLIFALSTELVKLTAQLLGCEHIYADSCNKLEKSAIMDRFQSPGSRALVATPAISEGHHVVDVMATIHIEMLPRPVNHIQAAGRGARGRYGSISTLLYSKSPGGDDFDLSKKFAYTTKCRRLFIDDYMDGVPEATGQVCGQYSPGELPCDICRPELDDLSCIGLGTSASASAPLSGPHDIVPLLGDDPFVVVDHPDETQQSQELPSLTSDAENPQLPSSRGDRASIAVPVEHVAVDTFVVVDGGLCESEAFGHAGGGSFSPTTRPSARTAVAGDELLPRSTNREATHSRGCPSLDGCNITRDTGAASSYQSGSSSPSSLASSADPGGSAFTPITTPRSSAASGPQHTIPSSPWPSITPLSIGPPRHTLGQDEVSSTAVAPGSPMEPGAAGSPLTPSSVQVATSSGCQPIRPPATPRNGASLMTVSHSCVQSQARQYPSTSHACCSAATSAPRTSAYKRVLFDDETAEPESASPRSPKSHRVTVLPGTPSPLRDRSTTLNPTTPIDDGSHRTDTGLYVQAYQSRILTSTLSEEQKYRILQRLIERGPGACLYCLAHFKRLDHEESECPHLQQHDCAEAVAHFNDQLLIDATALRRSLVARSVLYTGCFHCRMPQCYCPSFVAAGFEG